MKTIDKRLRKEENEEKCNSCLRYFVKSVLFFCLDFIFAVRRRMDDKNEDSTFIHYDVQQQQQQTNNQVKNNNDFFLMKRIKFD